MIEIATGTPNAPNGLVRPRNEAVEAPRAEAAPVQDVQRLCLAVLREEWNTLALVSTEPGAPGRYVARALVETARTCRLRPVRDLNASGVAPSQLPQLLDELVAARNGAEGRALLTIEDPRSNLASAPLLVAAEKVLLLVRPGVSRIRSVAEIVELVGRERVVGCILLK
ncbi:MAG TPA: hypothetical protein VF875_13230 [Anaeromyxobacter sp.]